MKKFTAITGGTGFIGSHLSKKFLEENENLLFLKRSYSNLDNVIDFKDDFNNMVMVDIDKNDISTVFDNYDIEGIVHLATFYKKFHKSEDIESLVNSNILFSTKLLENAVNSSVKYFINTGTFFEYDLSHKINESSAQKPLNLYSATKISFENILKYYSNEYALPATTLKLFTPYGPKDDDNKLIPYLILNILKKNKITIKTASKAIDVVYVDDIVDAYIKTIRSIKFGKIKDYEVFNICSGKPITIKNIYSEIESIIGYNESELLENEEGKIDCCNDKSKKILDWKVKTTLNEGLHKTIEYYKSKYRMIL